MYNIIVAIVIINIIMMIRLGYKVYLTQRISNLTKQLRCIECKTKAQRYRYVSLVNKRLELVNRYNHVYSGR